MVHRKDLGRSEKSYRQEVNNPDLKQKAVQICSDSEWKTFFASKYICRVITKKKKEPVFVYAKFSLFQRETCLKSCLDLLEISWKFC